MNMNIGPFESVTLFAVLSLVYIIPIIFVVYWMIKMLKNSNENLRINREILEILENKEENA